MPPFVPDIPYKIQFIFLLTFSYIWITAFIDDYNEPLPDPITHSKERQEILRWNTLRGLAAALVYMCSQSYLKPYLDQIFSPYERFWRIVSTLSNLYLCFIIFMLHQRPETGRAIWGFIDPSLNQPVGKDMHTYDDECDFNVTNLWNNIDHYFLVHVVNWFLASLVIRDAYILHFWSIFDEFVELSWQHILPHFRECWWDHILMDICFTNTPAIILGLKVVEMFGFRKYDWLGREGKTSIYDWEIFKCHRRFGVICYMFILLLIHFVAGFFIINAFLIPPKHAFTIGRLLLWFGLGNIGMREGYQDVMTWNTYERKFEPVEGRHRWTIVGILATESILSYKYREGTGNIQNAPTPLWVSLPWGMFIGSICVYWLYLRFKKNRTKKYVDQPTQLEKEKKLK